MSTVPIPIPQPPYDVVVINSIPVEVETLQIISTDVLSFDDSVTDINDNLLVVLSDDYNSTIKENRRKVSSSNVTIDNGVNGSSTQRICVASNNLPLTITPSAPISTLKTITNTLNIQTDGLTDKVQLATDINDLTNTSQQLMSDSLPVSVASDQSNVGIILNEVANAYKSNNDSIETNWKRINDNNTTFFGTGSATNGTQKVVLTNDYLSTFRNEINDCNISAQTTDMDVNVTNTTLSTNLTTVSASNITLSQKVSASSVSVVVASDQSSVQSTFNAGTNLNTSSLMIESSGNLDIIVTNTDSISSFISSINGKMPTQGQKTSANSIPVVIASNQGVYTVTANAGTNLNTSALALESGGNLDTIVTNTGNIDTSTASINTKIPSQGQATMAQSTPIVIASNQSNVAVNLTQVNGNTVNTGTGNTSTSVKRVIITNDYLSTTLRQLYIPQILTYEVAEFISGASRNMAQNLGAPRQTTFFPIATGGDTKLYAHKVTMTIQYSSGTVDSDGWGTGGQVLSGGFRLQYLPDDAFLTINLSGSTNTIKTLKDVIRVFDTHELYSWGSGQVFKATLFFPKHFIIDTFDAGYIQYFFSPDDLTGGGTVSNFESHFWYWSKPV